MIVLAILTTIAALVWSFVVFLANGMSDGTKFQGRLSLIAVWIVVAIMWLAWWFN